MPYQHPFSCQECSKHPKRDFTIYTPVDDWLICYPETNLLHIHFGLSTHDDQTNIAEAQFHYQFLQTTMKRNPGKQFFYIVDMTRKDDSEFVTEEAKEIYRKIRSHPQLAQGAIYGYTSAMKVVLSLLFRLGGNHTQFVTNQEEADAAYRRWFERLMGRSLSGR